MGSKLTFLYCSLFSPISVGPALGRVPPQLQSDGTVRGVWEGYTHPVLLLQGDAEHLSFNWGERRHSYRPGNVPRAGLGAYLPVHCPRSEVNGKGKSPVGPSDWEYWKHKHWEVFLFVRGSDLVSQLWLRTFTILEKWIHPMIKTQTNPFVLHQIGCTSPIWTASAACS